MSGQANIASRLCRITFLQHQLLHFVKTSLYWAARANEAIKGVCNIACRLLMLSAYVLQLCCRGCFVCRFCVRMYHYCTAVLLPEITYKSLWSSCTILQWSHIKMQNLQGIPIRTGQGTSLPYTINSCSAPQAFVR